MHPDIPTIIRHLWFPLFTPSPTTSCTITGWKAISVSLTSNEVMLNKQDSSNTKARIVPRSYFGKELVLLGELLAMLKKQGFTPIVEDGKVIVKPAALPVIDDYQTWLDNKDEFKSWMDNKDDFNTWLDNKNWLENLNRRPLQEGEGEYESMGCSDYDSFLED